MDRRKTADVLFFALQCAKDDRLAFADAVEGDKEKYDQAIADVRAFERLQIMIFGTKDSKLDAQLRKMESFSIYDVKNMLKNNPEIFIHADGCECEYCQSQQT